MMRRTPIKPGAAQMKRTAFARGERAEQREVAKAHKGLTRTAMIKSSGQKLLIQAEYGQFLREKIKLAPRRGFDVPLKQIHPGLKPLWGLPQVMNFLRTVSNGDIARASLAATREFDRNGVVRV